MLQRFPVKSMGGELSSALDLGPGGIAGDRQWAVYGADGKLASGKHTRRFRRMDPVFGLATRSCDDGELVVRLPDGSEHLVGAPATDATLSEHFGEQVALRRETTVRHQDAAEVSLVGSATLVDLGRGEGDGRPVDPRHLRVNLVLATDEPFVEERWIGSVLQVGSALVEITGRTERCRMVSVAQVGLPARRGLLKVIAERHELCAGVYGRTVSAGRVRLSELVRLA